MEPFNNAEGEPEIPVQVSEEPENASGQEPEQDDQEEQGGQQVRGNPFARLRVLERESRVIANRFNDLISRLDQPRDQEAEEEEEPIPDFEANPLAAIHERQVRMEKKQAEREKQEKENQLRQAQREVMTFANEAIKDYIEEQPDYPEAVKFIASLEFEEEMDDNPNLSAEEIDNILLQKLNEKKIAWIRAGKNPGHEIYKKALRRGYKPGNSSEGKSGSSAVDAKDQIAAERKRQQAGSSIAKAAGRASEGKVTASAIARMSDAEYREWADRIAKERGSTKIKMRDLVKDKIRER